MKKIYSSKLKRKGNLIALVVGTLVLAMVALSMSSCKAWRTVSTSASYTVQEDSVNCKTVTTISTKTVEEYNGKKNKP